MRIHSVLLFEQADRIGGNKVSCEYVISMNQINKKFGGVYALRDVNLQLKKGTVLALLGENGAGKSTLMKILTGVISKDSGSITLNGKEINPKSYAEAQEMGIALVPQELALVDYFTVAENIYLGQEPHIPGTTLVDFKKMYSDTENLLEKLKIKLNAKAKVKDLSVSDQQMLVIARILAQDTEVIILDEPTARLGYQEINELLTYIQYLKNEGKSIIYISHRLEEIFKISDDIMVLRDGCFVGACPACELDEKSLIHMMVNRDVEFTEEFVQGRTYGDVVFQVENLSRSHLVKDVSFEVRAGEVVGFFGLVGSGRTETIRSVLGIDKKTSGNVYLNGQKVQFKNIRDSIKAGVVLVPEERRKQGLVLSRSIRENGSLGNLKKFSKFGFLQQLKEKSVITACVDMVHLSSRGIEQAAGELSGGNQQKVVLAKLLARDNLNVYIFDEPTRGIDVGAKSEIYRLIADFVKKGTPCIVISSEIPEIQALCDRVVVMSEGKVTTVLEREQLKDANEIMKYAIA